MHEPKCIYPSLFLPLACPRSQALPGNALHEALPPFNSVAEPQKLHYEAEPRNEGGSKARSPNVLKCFDYEIIIIAKTAKSVPL